MANTTKTQEQIAAEKEAKEVAKKVEADTKAKAEQEAKEKAEADAKEKAAKVNPNDKNKAKELMLLHEVDTIFKVGKYWFTKLEYAEAAKKKVEKEIQTFKKQ